MEIKNYIDKLFNPKSIAIIEAASKRFWQISGTINWRGKENIYLVSKKEDEIYGIKCYQDISKLPDKIDLTMISVNRNRLKETVKTCIEKKFYIIHIFTAGGAEFDEKGEEIEHEIYELIKNSHIRAIGPNCMGVYSPEGKITYSPPFSEKPGSVAFVSQSGDITTQFILRENNYGVYFSKVASIGNSIDLTTSDFINYFSSDKKTEIIGVYFEGFTQFNEKEGIKLLNALKKNKKPLLFLRGGTTIQGKRAIKSHTGTIATDNGIWGAIFKQTSALKVDSFNELIDSTMAFNYYKNFNQKVKSLVLVGWSGGKAVLSTDQVVQLGIDVPEISAPTRNKMEEMISIGSVSNPLDLPWIGREDKYVEICKLAINEDYIGGVIFETGTWEKFDERFNKYFKNLVKIFNYTKQLRKPFFVSLPYSHLYKQREEYKNKLIEIGIPVFPSILRAAKTFLNLYEFRNHT
ncbi:MAG: CoA-binding protein [Promethearchaeota archaeon]